MKHNRLASGLLLGLLLAVGPAFAQSNVQKLNTDGIAKAMGKEGELTGDMYRVSFPRSDLTVKVGKRGDQAGVGSDELGCLHQIRQYCDELW
jgi:hypothetical protein